MKSLAITDSIQKQSLHSETVFPNFRNALDAISIAYSKFRQRAAERALADAVVEQHYREAKQKAFELTLGIRADRWKGH